MMRYLLGCVLFVLMLFSCKKEDDITEVTPVLPVSTVSFATDVQPIFNTHCNGSYCHGGGASGKYFDTYANVKQVSTTTLLGAINHSAGYSPMPKSQPKLRQGEIDTITAWINEGQLDN